MQLITSSIVLQLVSGLEGLPPFLYYLLYVPITPRLLVRKRAHSPGTCTDGHAPIDVVTNCLSVFVSVICSYCTSEVLQSVASKQRCRVACELSIQVLMVLTETGFVFSLLLETALGQIDRWSDFPKWGCGSAEKAFLMFQ